jgi:pilus assembly protein TadC
MKFKIPFTISSIGVLKKKTKSFARLFRGIDRPGLKSQLDSAEVDLTVPQYLGISAKTTLIAFVVVLLFSTSVMYFFNISNFYVYGLGIAFLFSFFVFMRQLMYPRMYSSRKSKNIEKNLISALQDMLVQLESGVPIYQILVNIASTDYGMVSKEFRKAVKEINSGVPQVEALEHLIKKNDSEYFKRVLWQISNGLRSGSDMSVVIKDSIDNLNKEQSIQIQTYGNKLNPLIMFYMLIAVIIPSLGITFFIILASMIGLSSLMVKLLLSAAFVFIILIQIMFLGLIKTRRPSLL